MTLQALRHSWGELHAFVLASNSPSVVTTPQPPVVSADRRPEAHTLPAGSNSERSAA